MNPKISIITVTLNSASTLEQTISSVINQSYKNIEYIVIDGASTDGTLEVIKKYDSNIAYWISEPDKGIYDAMNKGVSAATGDYVEILGSDDCFCSSEMVQNVVDEMVDDIDIYSGQQWVVVDGDHACEYMGSNMFARNKNKYKGRMIPHGSMFVKRELLNRYPFDVELKIAGDYKFFLQCYFDDQVHIQYSDLCVTYFAAMGTSSNQDDTYMEYTKIHKELGLSFKNEPTLKKITKNMLNRLNLRTTFDKWYKNFRVCFVWRRHHCNNTICRWCGRWVK